MPPDAPRRVPGSRVEAGRCDSGAGRETACGEDGRWPRDRVASPGLVCGPRRKWESATAYSSSRPQPHNEEPHEASQAAGRGERPWGMLTENRVSIRAIPLRCSGEGEARGGFVSSRFPVGSWRECSCFRWACGVPRALPPALPSGFRWVYHGFRTGRRVCTEGDQGAGNAWFWFLSSSSGGLHWGLVGWPDCVFCRLIGAPVPPVL